MKKSIVLILISITLLYPSKFWAVLSTGENLLSTDSLLISEELLEFQAQGTIGGSGDYPYNNHSGWGLLYYNDNRLDTAEQVWHSPIPAIDDSTFQDVVEIILAESNSAHIAMGHVRRASTGAEDIANPHPFHHHRQGSSLTFAHNGTISKTGLLDLLTNDGTNYDWIERTPPNSHGCGQWNTDGWDCVVDSELYFLYLLKNIQARNDIYTGLRVAATTMLQEFGESYELNYVFSDGAELFGFRSTDEDDDRHDLYYAVAQDSLPDPFSDIIPTHYALMSYHPQDSTAGAMDWQNLERKQNIALNPTSEPIFYSSAVDSLLNVPDDYSTIQQAIDTAEEYQHIVVAPGVYVESIDFLGKNILISSALNSSGNIEISETIIRGTNPDFTVRIGDGAGPKAILTGFTIQPTEPSNPGILCENSTPTLSNLTIIGCGGAAAIICNNSSPKISNVWLLENLSRAIYASNSNLDLTNILITGNNSDYGNIFYSESSSITMKNCTIANNNMTGGSGAVYLADSDLQILNSILWNAGHDEIVFDAVGEPSELLITYTDIESGQSGIQNNDNGTIFWEEGNLDLEPQFILPALNYYYLNENSPLIGAGTDYFELGDTILLEMSTFEYGSPSPNMGALQVLDVVLNGCTDPNAANYDPEADFEDGTCEYDPFGTIPVPALYSTIQRAIDVASTGDTVLISPGTYQELIDFEDKDLIIGSLFLTTGDTAYISQTIIDANFEGRVIEASSGLNDPAELAGLTLINGSESMGAGIRIYSGSTLWVHDLVISNCTASGSGGGIYISVGSQSEIEQVRITNCSGYSGGAIYIYVSDITVSHCRFEQNNATKGGAIYISKGDPQFDHLLITENSASYGGAIYVYCYSSTANPVFANCTITGNSASISGGGIYLNSNTYPTIYNSILWNNSPVEVALSSSIDPGSLTILHSDITGGEDSIPQDENFTLFWLGGNIAEDPLFDLTIPSEYNLQAQSPCIDAGVQDSLFVFNEGENQFQVPPMFYFNEAPDMGAVEHGLITFCDFGDLNQDSEIDILDVIITITIIMGDVIPNDHQNCAANLNFDLNIDVLDVIILVNMILDD